MVVSLESECGSVMFSDRPKMTPGARSRMLKFRGKSASSVVNYDTCARSSQLVILLHLSGNGRFAR